MSWTGPDGMMDTKEVKGLGSLNKTLLRSRVVHFGELLLDRWEQAKIHHGMNPLRNNNFGRCRELEDLLPGARLINLGRNVGLFWDFIEGDHLEIWFAEISLERRQGGEIWGNIKWSNAVMTVDPFLHRYKALIRKLQSQSEASDVIPVTTYFGHIVNGMKCNNFDIVCRYV
ncbi:putative F-box/kelch-repeat protein At3g24610 [Capsella rubella]|uniref:putative F-box/kelch-repeat protein At3g24610 n=1 Tax=Capsella rubella TaxID=81985 RepID=UPI000CD4D778|nr:putative F-box/kelch-repeat protein At3g24610 [Capsella rubella]